MNTELAEAIEISLTGSELPVHIVCWVCFPVNIPFETYALCGARLVGIDHPSGTPLSCDKCAELETEPCPKCGF